MLGWLLAQGLAWGQPIQAVLFHPMGHQLIGETLSLPVFGSGSAPTFWLASTAGVAVGQLRYVGVDGQREPLALAAAYPPARAYMVSPEILALQVDEGTVLRGRQVAYRPTGADRVVEGGWVRRGRQFIGYRVGESGQWLRILDRRLGPRLDLTWAVEPTHYRLISEDDPAYATATAPQMVGRKSKPVTMAEIGPQQYDWRLRHTLYLSLPIPLTPGKTYRLLPQGPVEAPARPLAPVTFTYDPLTLRSEAVQVSQVGFAPEDPVKVAYLSTWMGDRGPLDYPPDLSFSVLDQATGQSVYTGPVVLSKAADEPEDGRDRNYTGTPVYQMDFSAVTTPGTYRVSVEGVGTSFPFKIQPQVWEGAFYTSVRGLYHQRSGLALGPPYTSYRRPRPFHPADGLKVYQSTLPLMDTRMGLNPEGEVFEALVAARTDTLVPEAWGGWFDAGDWDRRIQHLEVSRLLLELALLFPDYFSQVNLNLPESDNTLPDVVDEALWGLDVFKRLQLHNGAIRGGIESAEHPEKYEASWQESQLVMAYGPDIWSSYIYAGVAARAAYLLNQLSASTLAQGYGDSAIRAMDWAETAWAGGQGQDYPEVANERNLAAAELYRLTGEERWHQLFLDTTVFKEAEANLAQWQSHDQGHAAFVYGQTIRPNVNPTVQRQARAALVRAADEQRQAIANTGFKWYKHPQVPMGWGNSLGGLKLTELLRAHALTGEDDYLESAILAAQFALGANPDNMTYTTGLGQRYPQDPLVVDARATGQTAPPGITVYGPLDLTWKPDYWAVELFKDVTYPSPWDWPTLESYFDVASYIPVTEFTVMQTIGPTAYGLGYLAAEGRKF